jgi:hypothetical protein
MVQYGGATLLPGSTAANPLGPDGKINFGLLQSMYPGTGTGADPNALKVYMGMTSGLGGGFAGQDGPKGPQESTLDVDSAKAYYGSLQPEEQKAISNKLYRAGLISDPGNYTAAVSAWQDAVDYAGLLYTKGGRRVTPWDVLQTRIGLADKELAKANAIKHPATTTSTITDVLTNGDANSMIKSMYQNELGRDPTSGELSRYRSMLINRSRNSPQTTTTTHKYGAGLNGAQGDEVSQSSTTTGGFSQAAAGDLLQGKVHADPEYGAYQAATTYMSALESAMSGGPNLVGS